MGGGLWVVGDSRKVGLVLRLGIELSEMLLNLLADLLLYIEGAHLLPLWTLVGGRLRVSQGLLLV